MRILSQDGTVDVPYELTSIQLVSKTTIVAQGSYFGSSSNDNFVTVAEYSTEAKAQKAMEMLHRAYIGMPIVAVKDVEMDVKMVSDAIRNGFVQPMPLNEQKIECDIFRFPKDEDLEV